MPRIHPLPDHEVAHLRDQFDASELVLGFVPNSAPTMARVPGLLEGVQQVGAAVFLNSGVDPALLQMVAQIASSAAGCRYCQAHTAGGAHRVGVTEEKLADLWLWETSDHFDDAERAALRLALHAGSTPNTVTDAHVDELRTHFDDDQIAGIVGVISLFGFLNRWNDTMATELEDEAASFAGRVLAASGWEAGRHAGEEA
ncbi:MAG: carboxymuconolactone decarboxylase family protein [Actinomycetota bacterium]